MPHQHGNKWEVTYRIAGYDKPFHEAYESKKEAELREKEIAVEKARGTLVPPVNGIAVRKKRTPKLKELLEEFIENYGFQNWGATTASLRIRQLENYLYPHPISERLITHIRKGDINRFYIDLEKTPAVVSGGHKDLGKKVGRSVIEKIDRTLHTAFQYAIDQDYLDHNPVKGAKCPKHKQKKIQCYQEEDLSELINSCEDLTEKVGYMLALAGSLRAGEVGGLHWSDLCTTRDGSQAIRVVRQIKRLDKKYIDTLSDEKREEILYYFPETKKDGKTVLVEKTLKTEKSARLIVLPPTVTEHLKQLKQLQEERKQELHGLYEDHDLIIAQNNGYPFEPNYLNKQLSRHTEKIGKEHVVFHSLRHSGSSMKLLYTGGDIQGVKESNGQATSRMVTDQYGHLFQDSATVIAQKLEENFFSRSKSDGEEEKLKKVIRILEKRPELMDLILAMGKG